MQITLMSLYVGQEIGLEMHPDVDQFIRIEQGQGEVTMGDMQDMVDFKELVQADDIIIIPAGKWHNLVNTGSVPLKLYSIYAPANHPFGTIHHTKQDAFEVEERYYDDYYY
jgi:mannose-6-phosphate isomerase-like protein (cupin superfamily)